MHAAQRLAFEDEEDEDEDDDRHITGDTNVADTIAQSASQVGSGNCLSDKLDALSEGAADAFAEVEHENNESETTSLSLFRPPRERKRKLRRDMYKVFHGSALMAIGGEIYGQWCRSYC